MSGQPSTTSTPTSTPTISGAQRAAEIEIELAGIAAAIRSRSGLAKSQRSLLSAITAAHGAHVATLATTPSGPATSGSKLPRSTAGALAHLAGRERSAARRYRATALNSSGSDALLWSSLSLAAAGFAAAAADASPPKVATLRAPRPAAALSDTGAVQELVRQLHAVVYGYQLAIGQLPVSSQEHARAVRELRRHRVVRDRQIAWLIRRSADVPAAEAAYVPSVNPSNARAAEKLIMKMLVAFQPFCGLWIAAADDGDRERAFDLLATTIGAARTWGAPISPWPGYA